MLLFFVILGLSLSLYGYILDSAKETVEFSVKKKISGSPTTIMSRTTKQEEEEAGEIEKLENAQKQEVEEVLGETVLEQNTQDGVKVLEVFDGDTVKLETGEVIRLLGMNAPETGEPYSAQSKQFLKETLLNRGIQLEYDVATKDRYGRTLAYLYSGSLFVNLESVKRGFSIIETIAPNVAHVNAFKNALDEAKKNCSGMWEGLCALDPAGPRSNSCVQIASIQANPKGDDNLHKNDEWIEINNTCSSVQNVTNWLIKDNSASNSYSFKTFSLSPGSTIKIHSGCGVDNTTDLYWKCPEGKYAVWNNSGDHAYLYNSDGVLVSDYQY